MPAQHACARLAGGWLACALVLSALLVSASPAYAQQGSASERTTTVQFNSIKNDPVQLAMFLRGMPKGADLHYHLSGGIYAESYITWAAQDSMCVDTTTYSLSRPPCAQPGRVSAASALPNSILYGQLIDAWSMRNWNPARRNGHDQFFDTFGKFGPASGPARTADMLAEVATRAGANKVSYMEIMWTPDGSGATGLGRSAGWSDGDFTRLRDKLLAANMRDTAARTSRKLDTIFAKQRTIMGCDDPNATHSAGCDVDIRVMYQVLRAIPREQVFAQILLGFEMASTDPRVVGLNLVQPEDNYVAMRDFGLHMQIIQFMRPLYPNVKVSLHAGELAPGLVPPEGLRNHILQSVRIAGANRIGHGVDIAYENDARDLLKEMAAKQVMVEINLTSNAGILGVQGKRHPLHMYLKAGVPVALSTDDEGVSRSDITMEYQRAVEEQGLGYTDLKAMARNSIRFSFVDAATKKALLVRLNKAFIAFERK